ncbi:MAG: substrate-binding domain-containing protein [Prevotella sp.]|nr:substrate-binding domain-containing protein [Prevotella sp.]
MLQYIKKTFRALGVLCFLCALCASCREREEKFVIGISQCSEDIWRDKQNAEMRMAAYFHENVELRFAAAFDSDERQVQQIDSLVATGIDLLIVAPNQVATISTAIDRAYDRGLPVIVFERKTNSRKYTAFISADNYEMGRTMGEHIAQQLRGRGRVVEVMGLRGSSPAIDRHKGFADALNGYPGIQVVATLQGDWTEESGYEAVKQSLPKAAGPIDYVFAQNDRMAMGARRAFLDAAEPQVKSEKRKVESGNPMPRFCGIDGLPGKDGGIQLVQDSILAATYIYPTHGDKLLQLAVDILEGRSYKKETRLMSALVTSDNARVLQMQSEEIVRQSAYVDQLHNKASNYLQQLSNQRTIALLALATVGLLLLMAAIIYMYARQKSRIAKERRQMERARLDFYTQAAHELRTPLTLIEGPLAQLADTAELQQAGKKTSELFAIVRRNTQQLTTLVGKILDAQVQEVQDNSLRSQEDGSANLTSHSTLHTSRKLLHDSEEGALLLIVDDNADIRTYLSTILADHYRLLMAEDGRQGLEVARREVPDLIISDVMMPVMNGLEFCQQVKVDLVTSHIPVILLTARALSKHQVEGYQSGADAYITKPFAPELLTARIDNLLRSRQVLKDLFSIQVLPGSPNHTSHPTLHENLAQPSQAPSPLLTDPFLMRFRTVIEERMGDSDLSVEDIASDMALSRVQLYRKIKTLTGQSPVEQLRKARVVRGRQLLATTDKTISEVAYEVGFSAPSYFTKCFRDEFGISPSDMKGK